MIGAIVLAVLALITGGTAVYAVQSVRNMKMYVNLLDSATYTRISELVKVVSVLNDKSEDFMKHATSVAEKFKELDEKLESVRSQLNPNEGINASAIQQLMTKGALEQDDFV